jgi:hypothetical protein
MRLGSGRAAATLRTPALVAALLSAALPAVAGCSSATPGAAAADQARSAARPVEAGREITAAESALLYTAEQTLIRQCMSRRGFQFWITPSNPVPEYRDFPYVVDDVAWARKHGYGSALQRRMDRALTSDPNHRHVESLPAARRAAHLEALNGRPHPGGTLRAVLPSGMVVGRSDRSCVSEAQRNLYTDLPAWYRASKVTENLPGLRQGLVHGDRRVIAGTTIWSRCMRLAGYPYADPGQARAAVPPPDRPGALAREIRVATAEATCAGQSGLAATVRDRDRHVKRLVDQRYRSEVSDRLRLQLAALPRARAVVEAN